MTLYRCCPTNCYDDCCEYMAACALTQPTSITYTVDVYCTRKYYVGTVLKATIVTADYSYSYTATNFSTVTVTAPCGDYDEFVADTLQYTFDGDEILQPMSEFPSNSGRGGCDSCTGSILPCLDWCGPGCTTCSDPDWEWCYEYQQKTKNTSLTDWRITYGCCLEDGCHRPCIKFEFIGAGSRTETSGTLDNTEVCCGAVADTPGAYSTTHEDFTVVGACGCPGTFTWSNIKVLNFQWSGFAGSTTWSGGSPQTFCSGEQGPTYVDRGCGCTDYTTSPPTDNYVECDNANITWVDCCEYTVTVTVV